MTANNEMGHIIENGALQSPVIEQETARLDQIDLDPKASRKPQQAAGILRNVRLEQGETQATSMVGCSARSSAVY